MRANTSSVAALVAFASAMSAMSVMSMMGCDYPRPLLVGMQDAAGSADVDGGPTDGAVTDGKPVDAAPGTVSIVMTPPSASKTLGTTTRFTVQLTSNDFAGTVNLAASGGPNDWTKALPSSVALTSGQVQNVNFDVTIAPNGSAATAGASLTVSATISGMSPVTDSSTLTVANEYILPIASGVGTGAHWGTLTNLTLRNGSTFTIGNDDGTPHQVHASATITNLAHQVASMNQGQSYSVVLGSTGTDTIYCHVHNQPSGQFTITSQ